MAVAETTVTALVPEQSHECSSGEWYPVGGVGWGPQQEGTLSLRDASETSG